MEGKIRKGIVIFFISALALMLLSSMAEGADFCVSTAADLQSALTTAASNGQDDVIQLVQGTYVGNFVYSSAQPSGLTILGGYTASCATRTFEPRNTILDGQDRGHVLTIEDSSNFAIALTIEGLTFQNGYDTGVILSSSRGSVVIRNNVIRSNTGTYGGGIQVSGFWSVSVLGNFFLTNGADGYGGGLRIGGSGQAEVIIMENVFSGNYTTAYGGGGLVVGIPTSAPLLSIVNNLFTNNSSPSGGGAFIQVPGGVTRIANNTIAGNLAPGCGGGMVVSSIKEVIIINNIYWNNEAGSGSDLCFGSVPLTGVSMIANDLDQSAAGVSGLSGYVFDPSNFNKLDPQFVDMENEDFHLKAASPCIDSGDLAVVPLLPTDIEGLPRVVNDAVDMGAYEWQGSYQPTAPDLFGRFEEFHYYKFQERIVLEIQVKNRGTNSGEFKVSFYLSSNGRYLDALIDEKVIKKGLKSGKEETFSCRYTSEEPLSSKYIITVIDSADQVFESIETNNRVAIRIP